MIVRKTRREPQPKKPAPIEDDGRPLVPIPEPPLEGRNYIVPDHKTRTVAMALLDGLRAQRFTLRLADEKLLVSPLSKLSQLQRDAIKESKVEIMALLEWEAAESEVTEEIMQGWFQSLGKPYAVVRSIEKTTVDQATLARLVLSAKRRRIVLLAEDGSMASVLAEPSAAVAHAEVRRLASEHPGLTVAAEWLGPRGWIRWLQITEAA